MTYQVILVDNNQTNNVINEALIRDWNDDIDISIIDNSEEVLNFFKREFSGKRNMYTKTAIFLDEFIPQLEGVGMMEYVERMNIEPSESIDVYFLSNRKSEVLMMKSEKMSSVKKVIQKPLTAVSLAEILAA